MLQIDAVSVRAIDVAPGATNRVVAPKADPVGRATTAPVRFARLLVRFAFPVWRSATNYSASHRVAAGFHSIADADEPARRAPVRQPRSILVTPPTAEPVKIEKRGFWDRVKSIFR